MIVPILLTPSLSPSNPSQDLMSQSFRLGLVGHKTSPEFDKYHMAVRMIYSISSSFRLVSHCLSVLGVAGLHGVAVVNYDYAPTTLVCLGKKQML